MEGTLLVAVYGSPVCAETSDEDSNEELDAHCFISPSIARSRELLPAPTGPAMSNSSPRLTDRLTSLKTGTGSTQGKEVEVEELDVEPLSG